MRLKRDRRAISNVIVVMLSLILIVIVVTNVVLWSYQMNQLDWERMREELKIIGVSRVSGTEFTFENAGALTCHLVALWVDNSTYHQRFGMNLFINSGDTALYVREDITLPDKPYSVRIVTERGNIAIYSNDPT